MNKWVVWLLVLLLCLSCAMAEENGGFEELGYSDIAGLLPVKRNGMWGVIAPDGTMVIPCEWDGVHYLAGTNRIPVMRGGLWGCIDLAGNVVVEPVWDNLTVWPDDTMEVIRDGRAGLLDENGGVIISCGPYISVSYSVGGLYRVLNERQRYGMLNADGSVAVPAQWREIGWFSDGLAYATMDSRTWCYINGAGEVVIPGPFDDARSFRDGVAMVRVGSEYQFIDVQGHSLTAQGWELAKEFSCGLAMVKRNGLYGYIDCTGETVIPLQFSAANAFAEGVALVQLGEERIAIDTTGQRLFGCEYDAAYGMFFNGFIWVMKDGKYGLLNRAGELVIPCEWDKPMRPFLEGDVMQLVRDGQLAFANRQGEMITGRLWDGAAVSYRIQGEYLYLLENGVLSIWNAWGEQMY